MGAVDGVEITGPGGERCGQVLRARALGLTASLHRESDGRRPERTGAIRQARGDASTSGRWDDARALFTEMALADEYPDSLTVPAYERTP